MLSYPRQFNLSAILTDMSGWLVYASAAESISALENWDMIFAVHLFLGVQEAKLIADQDSWVKVGHEVASWISWLRLRCARVRWWWKRLLLAQLALVAQQLFIIFIAILIWLHREFMMHTQLKYCLWRIIFSLGCVVAYSFIVEEQEIQNILKMELDHMADRI